MQNATIKADASLTKKQSIVSLNGIKEAFVKNINIEGFGVATQDSLFKDTVASPSMGTGNLYIDNVYINDSNIYNHEIFNVRNYYIDKFTMRDVEIKDGDIYKSIFKQQTAVKPISYISNLNLDYTDNTDTKIKSIFDTELTLYGTTRKFIMNDTTINNVHSSETLIDLVDFGSQTGDARYGRSESVTLDGEINITNCVTDGTYIMHIEPRAKTNDRDTVVKVNNNTIKRGDETGLRAIVKAESVLSISGVLYINGNTFDMTSVPSDYINAGLYYGNTENVM